MADPIVNFFKSTLVGTYSDTDTSITIATGDGALLPDPSTDGAFNLTIFEGVQVTNSTSFEIVRVTARSGDVLTVTRGAESTTPLTIGSATHSILMSATKKTFDDIRSEIDNIDLTTITGAESITFDTTGDEEFGLPAGTTAQRPASPSAGYMRFNTDTKKLEVHTGGVWGLVSLDNVLEMQVAQATVTANDAVFLPPVEVEYLVIAGGGSGGDSGDSATFGGGGAGGYRSSVVGESSGGGASAESTLSLTTSTNYTVTVGAGGSVRSVGSNSVFSTITSTGGGHGAGGNTSGTFDGGSGGGGGNGTFTSGGSGTASQGFDGGDRTGSGRGAGGGGAGAVGQDSSTDDGGDGGDGVASSITGSSVTRAGGGGGASGDSGGDVGGSGGTGGGGNGESADGNNATAGTANTGGGGGGSFATGSKAGGSGVVILRYPSDYSITIGAGLTGTESTDGSEKYAVITAGTGNVSWS